MEGGGNKRKEPNPTPHSYVGQQGKWSKKKPRGVGEFAKEIELINKSGMKVVGFRVCVCVCENVEK